MWLSRTARLPRRFPRGAGGALVVLWAPGDAFAAPDVGDRRPALLDPLGELCELDVDRARTLLIPAR